MTPPTGIIPKSGNQTEQGVRPINLIYIKIKFRNILAILSVSSFVSEVFLYLNYCAPFLKAMYLNIVKNNDLETFHDKIQMK